jgi:hypothetical protein
MRIDVCFQYVLTHDQESGSSARSPRQEVINTGNVGSLVIVSILVVHFQQLLHRAGHEHCIARTDGR